MEMVKRQINQVKGELQLKDLKDSVNFISEKFPEYEKNKKKNEKGSKIVRMICPKKSMNEKIKS